MTFIITARCEKGHEQAIKVNGTDEATVKVWAGIMDGSSDFYIYSPVGKESVIGKCATCGVPIKCEVKPASEGENHERQQYRHREGRPADRS